MKKIATFVLFSVLGLALTSCTINRPAPQERTISVNGTGKVYVEADLVYLNFLVRTIHRTVNTASERNASVTNNVLAAIKEAGIDSADIQTKDYSIRQDLSHSYPGDYTVTNTISIVIRNTELTGTIIDTAIANGANGLTSFTYGVSDTSTALRQARTLAVKDAQDAANLLAGASGCKVADVKQLSESYTTTSSNNFEMKALARANSTPIENGSIEISSHINVIYNLE